jgi:hypothetical protein
MSLSIVFLSGYSPDTNNSIYLSLKFIYSNTNSETGQALDH